MRACEHGEYSPRGTLVTVRYPLRDGRRRFQVVCRRCGEVVRTVDAKEGRR